MVLTLEVYRSGVRMKRMVGGFGDNLKLNFAILRVMVIKLIMNLNFQEIWDVEDILEMKKYRV